MAHDNWDIVMRPSSESTPKTDDGTDAMEREYISKLLHQNGSYTIDPPQPAPAASAAPPDEGDEAPGEVPPPTLPGPMHFQVVAIHKGSSRPKVMPTHETATDVAMHAKLALQVLFFAPWGEQATDRAVVYAESDLQWVVPTDLGSINDLVNRLFRWNVVETNDEHQGCLTWLNRVIARPAIPLMDESCPTLMILWYLRAQGWRYQKRTVIHTLHDMDRKVCDGRDNMKHKLYLQVLCILRRCMELTSSIPSDQPQLFYRLLLAGERVEPHLGNAAYEVLAKRKGKKALLPLPCPEPGLEDEPPLPLPPPPDEDEDLVVGEAGNDPRPKKKARTKASAIPLPPAGADPPSAHPPPGPGAGPSVHPGRPVQVVVCPGPGGPGGDPPPEGSGGEGDVRDPVPVVNVDEDLVVEEPPAPPRAPPRGKRGKDWRDALDGGLGNWCFDIYRPPDGGKRYPNWQFKCPNPLHKNCFKTVGALPKHIANFGAIECAAFLHAWRDAPITDETKTHRNHEPDLGAVEAFATRYKAVLEAAVAEAEEALENN